MTFIKIGDRIINADHISIVDSSCVDEEGVNCVALSLLATATELFYDEEARILIEFLLKGNRAYDLNNLYGDRNS